MIILLAVCANSSNLQFTVNKPASEHGSFSFPKLSIFLLAFSSLSWMFPENQNLIYFKANRCKNTWSESKLRVQKCLNRLKRDPKQNITAKGYIFLT